MPKTTVNIKEVEREQLENVVMQLQHENRILVQELNKMKAQNEDLGTRLSDMRTLVKMMEPIVGLTNFVKPKEAANDE